jgi:hypothetical protein
MLGQLIYLFKDDSEGVPEELVNYFLGITPDVHEDDDDEDEDEGDHDVFAPLRSTLDSSSSFFEGPLSWTPVSTVTSTTRDPDRPTHCAYNLPAVTLTLGSSNWSRLAPLYTSLSKTTTTTKVIQSLASSTHEIAMIIGPEQATDSLLQPFCSYLNDIEIIQHAALEFVAITLNSFHHHGRRVGLKAIAEAWKDIRNWRMREHVVLQMGEIKAEEGLEEVLRVVSLGMKDSVAKVREAAVVTVCSHHSFISARGYILIIFDNVMLDCDSLLSYFRR